MLHLRVISPAETTQRVLEVLRKEPGATHITQHRGAALEPRGDVVEADVARECADAILDRLDRLGVSATGGVTLETTPPCRPRLPAHRRLHPGTPAMR